MYKNGYVRMAVEQSLHYCLSESKMIGISMASFWEVMYGLFNCHPYIAIFIGMLVIPHAVVLLLKMEHYAVKSLAISTLV